MKELYVDKTTGTLADQLAAFGLAVCIQELLRRVPGQSRAEVTVADGGGHYRLELSTAIDEDIWGQLSDLDRIYTPIPALQTPKNAATLPQDLPGANALVDYEAVREQRATFFQRLNALPAKERADFRAKKYSPGTEQLAASAPSPDWDIYRALNPAALIGYNKLVAQWWATHEALPEVMGLLCALYGSTPNDLAGAEAEWKKLAKAHGWSLPAEASASQLFNPSQGKGQNRAKPDRLTMGNVSGFWLPEWLKAVGFYRAALTKMPRGSKDRKTYVLAPMELDLSTHQGVFKAFREAMEISQTPVLGDILVGLRYTAALLQYAQREEGESAKRRLLRLRRPRRAVSGFATAFYKNLGNATATMNVSFLGLPGWLSIEAESEIAGALEVLTEHESIVRQFDESHSDDYSLLLAYRDFSSGEDLEAFFAFAVPYSGWIVGRRERNQYARQFTEENLRRLIMGSDDKLQPILDSEGFRNIAYAIRQSTVVAQFRKKQGDRRYDVRYGLGEQLARKAHYATDFIAELSDFLLKYNAENAQVMENRPGRYRRSINIGDIDDIVALIDTYGSRTICNLLVAYGYARSGASRDVDEPDVAPPTPDDESAGDLDTDQDNTESEG